MQIAEKIVLRPVSALVPYARNPRIHSPEQVAQIAASIAEFGFTNPVLVDEAGGIIAGHGRVLAAQQLAMDAVPTIELGYLSETQRRAYLIADNKLALNAGWDQELLRLELNELIGQAIDPGLLGFGDDELRELLAGAEAAAAAPRLGNLAERFGVPPFSVLNAREGWWQARKAAWLALGIQSELGRGLAAAGSNAPGGSLMPGRDKASGLLVRADGAARPIAGTGPRRARAGDAAAG